MNNMNEQSLLQEIEEDLARQRTEKLWKKYGNTVMGIALAIVLATAAVSGYKTYRTNTTQKATAAYMTQFETFKGKESELMAALEPYAKDNKGTTLAVFAQFNQAGLALSNDKKDKALEVYNAIAADATVEPVFRELADLLYVQTELDTGDVATLEARLQPLMNGSPWQYTAREFAGNLAIRAGDKEKATKIFTELKTMPNVPKSIEGRAKDVLNWLKGA